MTSFYLFNKVNYFTFFGGGGKKEMNKTNQSNTLFMYATKLSYIIHVRVIHTFNKRNKYPYQTSNLVFLVLKECYKNMLPNTFFFLLYYKKLKEYFSTLIKSKFSYCFENQNYITLNK